MGFALHVKQGWTPSAKSGRIGKKMPQTSYYTVLALEPGFPVCFLCLHCKKVHCFPENPKEADFQDPGEASRYFKSAFSILGNWEYELPEDFLLRIYRNG